MRLLLTEIVLDDTIYPRNSINQFNVERMINALKTGVTLPPVIIEASTRRLIDGWHRHEAHKREEIEYIEVVEKTYATEADLFADAVRLNIGHGQPLDQYSVRNAVLKLTEYGYTRDQISDVVRLPVSGLEKIERGFAQSAETGQQLALKGGLNHLKGKSLTIKQQAVNKHYGGTKATFHVKQIVQLLQMNMWPDKSETFAREMDTLCELWMAIRAGKVA